MSECALCRRIEDAQRNRNSPFLVQELETGFLLTGDHQLFPGYCLLVAKTHVREFHDLPESTQELMTRELTLISKASQRAFNAEKINLASYGNMTPHLHWHIFPRKKSDAAWPKPPWVLMDRFGEFATTEEQARSVSESLRRELQK